MSPVTPLTRKGLSLPSNLHHNYRSTMPCNWRLALILDWTGTYDNCQLLGQFPPSHLCPRHVYLLYPTTSDLKTNTLLAFPERICHIYGSDVVSNLNSDLITTMQMLARSSPWSAGHLSQHASFPLLQPYQCPSVTCLDITHCPFPYDLDNNSIFRLESPSHPPVLDHYGLPYTLLRLALMLKYPSNDITRTNLWTIILHASPWILILFHWPTPYVSCWHGLLKSSPPLHFSASEPCHHTIEHTFLSNI